MESGTIVRWLKAPGQQVDKDEPLAEIESEKVVNELAAPAAGVLAEILVAAEEQAPVGALLAVIAEPLDDEKAVEQVKAREPRAAPQSKTTEDRTASTSGATASTPGATGSGKGPSISPAARRLAVENGLDWQTVSGTGPGGRIVTEDVKKALEKGEDGAAPLSPLRQAIAARTLESIKAPQAGLYREIDVTSAIENKGELSFTALIAFVAARTLALVPVLNARWEGDRLRASSEINIGIVLAIPEGIVVPVIRDAAHKSAADMDQEWKHLVEAAGAGALTREQVTGGTFTISNAGPLGIDFFQPLINPPEVAVLGIGAARKRPVVAGSELVIRTTAHFCMAADHRAVDAEPVAEFLKRLGETLAGTAANSR